MEESDRLWLACFLSCEIMIDNKLVKPLIILSDHFPEQWIFDGIDFVIDAIEDSCSCDPGEVRPKHWQHYCPQRQLTDSKQPSNHVI